MKRKSIWLENIYDQESILRQDITCDVLIVGAGMTGVATAYHLRNKGFNVVVVDKNKVGHGISARTTGKITYLQETIYSDLKKKHSLDVSKKYLDSQLEAIELIRSIIEEHHIDCDFESVVSYVFSQHENSSVMEEKRLLEQFGVEVEQEGNAIKVDGTYVFHPIKYILSLKEICKQSGVQFYEKTDIHFMKKGSHGYICGNELVSICAKKIVFACHYPYFLFPFLIPLKCTLERSYVSAAKVEKVEPYSAISVDQPVVSIRYHQDERNGYMIYASESHPLYQKYDSKKHFDVLEKSVLKMGLRPRYMWSNHDIMTFDQLPFIGRLEKGSRDLYLATGYNTWGMTNSNLAGKIISDMILDIYNRYEELFSPLRKLHIESLPKIIYGGMKPMIENKVWKSKKWNPDNVYFEGDLAIYVDKWGKEHVVYNRCPHMKCSLLFNSVEKTWDCPCHGSRFDLDGHVIIGPSNYNITYYH